MSADTRIRSEAGRDIGYGDAWMAVAVMGSLWGLSEVALDAAIRAAGLPMRAAFLTGMGMLLLGVLLGYTRRPALALAAPFVAMMVKMLVVPLLGVSPLCKANSCLAVVCQGAALAGLVLAFRRGLYRSLPVRVLVGFGAALAASAPFWAVGLRLAPCEYLRSFVGPAGFWAFMAREGLAWAVFAGVLFPAGFAVGAMARRPLESMHRSNPGAFYAVSIGLVAVCWTASAAAIIASA